MHITKKKVELVEMWFLEDNIMDGNTQNTDSLNNYVTRKESPKN